MQWPLGDNGEWCIWLDRVAANEEHRRDQVRTGCTSHNHDYIYVGLIIA